MKKIGHETLFLSTTEKNPRNGESTFVRLKDGRICLAFTEYYGGDWSDHATARISACYSSDEGESWTAPKILIEKAESDQNIMAPNLFRLPNGDLGMVYLRKKYENNGTEITCMPMFCCSADEGKTWSKRVLCTDEMGYYCIINDGCMVDSRGRIWVPMSYHGNCIEGIGFKFGKFKNAAVQFAVSDDCGLTWKKLPVTIEAPFSDDAGLAEPGIFEFEDGTLWMYCRTNYGFQYQSFSSDRGESWTPIEPSFKFTSPDAPMRVKKVGGLAVSVYNPRSFCAADTGREVWGSPKRTPLVCAVSRDGGKSFMWGKTLAHDGGFDDFVDNCYLLETDESESYCYAAVTGVEGGFLVAYYHSGGTKVCLNCTKVVKVKFAELEQQ